MELSDPSDEYLWKELLNSTDRGAAIIIAAYLDEGLVLAIASKLVNDKDIIKKLTKPSGPLGPSVVKADLGYLLGIYSKRARDDLVTIFLIRNKFAHFNSPLDFGYKEVRTEVEKLRNSQEWSEFAPDCFAPPLDKGATRFLYVSAADSLGTGLRIFARHPGHPPIG